jgi:uncharacterized protein (TIGR03066 family)
VAAGGRADEKDDYAKKVVGKWEVAKSDPGTIPMGAVLEFLKDGKAKATAKKDDVESTFDGTYKLDGKKLTLTMMIGEKERTNVITIVKATDTEMTFESEDGKKVEFTRKK